MPDKRLGVIGFVPILVIAAFLGAYLDLTLSSSYSGTTTTSAFISSPASISTINSTLGLELILSINSTVIPSQEAINITFQLENTLMVSNNLTAEANWPVSVSSGPCDIGNNSNHLEDPVGIAIFGGNYAFNNLSSANPLPVWAEVACPVDLVFNGTGILGDWTNITSYSLLAGMNNGTESGYYRAQTTGAETPLTSPVVLDFNDQFYASNPAILTYNTLNSALPGNYTVAAADEWGQIVLLHFQVVASNNLPEVGEFMAVTGGCGVSGYAVPCVTSSFSDATIFNCSQAAQSTAGCKYEANSSLGQPPYTFTITVGYPRLNQTGEPSWANCLVNERGEPTIFGYCFMVNSTAFAISEGGSNSP